MATSIVATTLTVTITEAITLDGVDRGSSHVFTVDSITEIAHRIMEIPTSEITILSFQATTPGAGTFNEADVRYIRLTNKDALNFIQLIIANESNDECAHKLEADSSMIISVSAEGVVNIHDAATGALTVSFDDITSITALADTAACDLEYYVAGV